MSSIPAPVQQALVARQDANRQQIQMTLLRKNLDAQKQTGDAVNELLEQAVQLQNQLSNGHIDIRV